jgi:cytochrome c oxidase assembly protein subunit 15
VHRLAVLTAGATVALIFVGGAVTNTGSGLAVPDWPTTFGQNMFLYPPTEWVGGILYEHSHRLLGALVGLLTVILAGGLWVTDGPRWLRWVGVVAVLAVIGQGVLGGLRVVLLKQTLAVVHGIIAQAFFGLTVALSVWTSPGWDEACRGRGRGAAATAEVKALRRLCAVTTCLVFLQIVAGVLVTHTGRQLQTHLVFAALLAVCGFWLVARVLGSHWGQPWLARPARALAGLLMLQLFLGLAAYLARFTALGGASMAPWLTLAIPLVHRVVGTLLLGTALLLVLRAARFPAMLAAAPQGAGAVPRRVPA